MTATDLALKLLAENKLCVLATSSLEGKPEAATIQYADEGLNVFFKTFRTYRKFMNMNLNPQTSIVITAEKQTLQMDGLVEPVSTEPARGFLIAKHGYDKEYFEDGRVRYFRFTPTWARVMIGGKYPPEFEELKL